MGCRFSLERFAIEILCVVLVYIVELGGMSQSLACEKKVSMTEGVTSAATPRVLKTMVDLFN